jgi:hypothetical protein
MATMDSYKGVQPADHVVVVSPIPGQVDGISRDSAQAIYDGDESFRSGVLRTPCGAIPVGSTVLFQRGSVFGLRSGIWGWMPLSVLQTWTADDLVLVSRDAVLGAL